MEKYMSVLALSFLVTHGAVIKNDNLKLTRKARSYEPCEYRENFPHHHHHHFHHGPPFAQERYASASANAGVYSQFDNGRFRHGFENNQPHYEVPERGLYNQGYQHNEAESQVLGYKRNEALSHSQYDQGYQNIGASSQAEAQSSQQGAFDLASQGLQTHGGCSTCGGSSNSISNAKSINGNAVAVSTG